MDTSVIQEAKLAVMAAIGLSKDALHVHVGLAVFIAMACLWRKRPRCAWPLLVVAGLAALGEMVDARDDLRSLGHWRWQASLHDIANTLFWPAVFWMLIRLRGIPGGQRPRAAG